MPYSLRKQRGHPLYWVITTSTGVKHSKEPLSKDKAEAQLRALYSHMDGAGPRPSNNIGQQVAEQSYQSSPKNSLPDGFNLFRSTPTLKFYKNDADKTILVGIRGTKRESNDIKADAAIGLDRLESSVRFQQDLATLQSVQSEFPPADGWDYYGFGHSLGGAILDVFLNMKLLKSGLSYNPAIQPKDFNNVDIPNDRIFAENDPLWMLAKPFLKKKPEVRAAKRTTFGKIASWVPYLGTAYDKLQGHRLTQFEGGMWHPIHVATHGGKKSKFQSSPLTEIKPFPEAYSKDAVEILDTMAFGPDLKLLGSMSLRSQLYAGDYDGFEIVKTTGPLPAALTNLRKKFQTNISALGKMDNVFIGDIKAGSVERWRLLPRETKIVGSSVVHWDYAAAMAKLHAMMVEGVLSPEEVKEATASLKPKMTPSDFFDARAICKFHVLRWKPAEVAANRLKLRDGSFITLEEAFQCPSIAKLDVIGWVQNNRFTDFSVIYEFHNGSKILNHDPIDIEDSLKADIAYYRAKGKYYKSLKREFALAKVTGDIKTINRLSPILNSDLGRLYVVYGDIGTLTNLLKMPHVSLENIRFELDQFIQRLSNVYGLDEFLRAEPTIRREIHRIGKLSRQAMIAPLEALEDKLQGILQAGTLKAVSGTATGRDDTGVTDEAAAEKLAVIDGAGRGIRHKLYGGTLEQDGNFLTITNAYLESTHGHEEDEKVLYNLATSYISNLKAHANSKQLMRLKEYTESPHSFKSLTANPVYLARDTFDKLGFYGR